MAKALCLTGMIVAILLMVLFTVDFFLQWPFKAFDGKWILDGLARSNMSAADRADMVITVLESMPDDCDDSEYRGESTR